MTKRIGNLNQSVLLSLLDAAYQCVKLLNQEPEIRAVTVIRGGDGLFGYEIDTGSPPSVDTLTSDYLQAQARLTSYLTASCPGEHKPVQHRDGKPPWCRHCKRTATGELVHP